MTPLQDKDRERLSGLGTLLSWLVLSFLVLAEYVFGIYKHEVSIPYVLKGLFFNAFIVCSYIFIRLRNRSSESNNFLQILGQICIIALISGLLSFTAGLAASQAGTGLAIHQRILLQIFYQIELGGLILFLLHAFVGLRQLVRYQKSSFIDSVWQIFEWLIFATMLVHFFRVQHPDQQAIVNILFQSGLIFFFVYSLFLSINVSWVAFLNLKQKVFAIVLLFMLLLVLYHYKELLANYAVLRPQLVDIGQSLFVSSILFFTGIYSIASILVLFFNLPTGSVVEQKFSEISDFKRLLEGKDEQHLYDIMLDIATNNFKADAAWLEINISGQFVYSKISQEEVEAIRNALVETNYRFQSTRKFRRKNLKIEEPDMPFSTLLAVPLLNQNRHLGTLILLSYAENYFDNVMSSLINTYASQASVALDNFRLISEAVENERYKTEIETAKKVQESLLPGITFKSPEFEILANSFSPELVGGDFYDYYQIAEHKHAIILGDVSGKGTSAAFIMAQMKGVFHSLVQLDLSPELFLEYANAALSRCLEKNSFITATYIVVDTRSRKIQYSRAGHCPILYYDSDSRKADFLQSRGLGMGILRNNTYKQYLEVKTLHYNSGDLIMLYTDGVIEAKENSGGDEYGYDRLKQFLLLNHTTDLEPLASLLVKQLRSFSKSEHLPDDYTILLLKFK